MVNKSTLSHISIATAAVAFLNAALVFAEPQGGIVTSGAGHISQVGNVTTVTQSSEHVNVNWQQFNIDAHETVNFVQPSVEALAVNHVQGVSASQIMGQLNANGQVWLINPNGIFFGQSATVNVGSILASTLQPVNDVANADGSLVFSRGGSVTFSGAGAATVVNQGAINSSKGYVAFLGHQVSNQGDIIVNHTQQTASDIPAGFVGLAAGAVVTVDFNGDGLYGLTVNQSALHNLAENKKLIQVLNDAAQGGTVILSAGAHDSVLASVVNNEGIIEAKSVAARGGHIILASSEEAGVTKLSGTLDVSSVEAESGDIDLYGNDLVVASDVTIRAYSQNSPEEGAHDIHDTHVHIHVGGHASGGHEGGMMSASHNHTIENHQAHNSKHAKSGSLLAQEHLEETTMVAHTELFDLVTPETHVGQSSYFKREKQVTTKHQNGAGNALNEDEGHNAHEEGQFATVK